MPIAVIAFAFDPLLRLGDSLVVRWQTVALAAVITVTLAAAGIAARREGLRVDDLLYLVIGAVPGAVVGARVGYLLTVPDAFVGGPLAILDPSIGGLELGLGVVGGVSTGAYVAHLLGASLGQWAERLAIPLLVALAAGKMAMALGGAGQGLPSAAAWATAYTGAGPWASLAPDTPSHPSQLYEGIATLGVANILALVRATGRFGGAEGRSLLVAIASWAVVRAIVSISWRDPAVVGPLPAAGVLALVIAAGAVGAVIVIAFWSPRRQRAREAASSAEPRWPEPEAGPRS